MTRIPPLPCRLRTFLSGFALLAGLALPTAPTAASVPGPPLDPAATPGAYCPSPADSDRAAAGFAAAVVAAAWIARRRHDPA